MLQTIINIGIPARLKKKGRIVSSFKSLDRKKVKQDLAASGQLSSATGSIPPTLYTMVPYFVTKMSKERRFKVHNGSWRKFVLRRRNRVSTIVPLFPEKLDRTIVPLKTIVWAEGGEDCQPEAEGVAKEETAEKVKTCPYGGGGLAFPLVALDRANIYPRS